LATIQKQLKQCSHCLRRFIRFKYYHFEVADFAGLDKIISATGYTGSGGFEIYVNEDAEQIWSKAFEAGAAFGIKPQGLAARDTLRLEMVCAYTETTLATLHSPGSRVS
jgi:glycine cleavage system aminomethyltransferase T